MRRPTPCGLFAAIARRIAIRFASEARNGPPVDDAIPDGRPGDTTVAAPARSDPLRSDLFPGPAPTMRTVVPWSYAGIQVALSVTWRGGDPSPRIVHVEPLPGFAPTPIGLAVLCVVVSAGLAAEHSLLEISNMAGADLRLFPVSIENGTDPGVTAAALASHLRLAERLDGPPVQLGFSSAERAAS